MRRYAFAVSIKLNSIEKTINRPTLKADRFIVLHSAFFSTRFHVIRVLRIMKVVHYATLITLALRQRRLPQAFS